MKNLVILSIPIIDSKIADMAILGYARVSTQQQKLDLQIEALQNEGVREDRIFTDKATGSSDKREGLQRLLIRAESGDSILCTKMDRLGRNTADMVNIVDDCFKKGIAIRFLENGLSTEGTMGKMVIQILAAVAEAERARILERTNEGRSAAMDAGIKFGRKKLAITDKVKKMILEGANFRKANEEVGVSQATFYRIKKAINNEL
jgi:DNA invertase Pin-like site-specific DNA recombinase